MDATLYEQMMKDQTEDIMSNFDFRGVHRAMKQMGWEWHGEGVPSLASIRRQARRLLTDSETQEDEFVSRATGGFIVHKNDNRLSLTFRVASYTPTDGDEYFFKQYYPTEDDDSDPTDTKLVMID